MKGIRTKGRLTPRRRTLLAAIACLLLLALATPSRAAGPAATQQQFLEAVEEVRATMVAAAAEGWTGACGLEGTGGYKADLEVMSFGQRSAGVLEGTIGGLSATWVADYRPGSWRRSIWPQSVEGLTPANAAAVFAKAGVPGNTQFVSGPYKPWANRYLDEPVPSSFADAREGIVDLLLGLLGVAAAPDATYVFSPSSGKGGTWSVTLVQGQGTFTGELLLDAQGRMVSSYGSSETGGQVQSAWTCDAGGYGDQPSFPLIDPAEVAPLVKVGPAAWRVSRTAEARHVAKAVRAAVVASGKVSASRILIEAGVELDKAGLVDAFTLSQAPGGAKISATDPLGGVVRRCMVAKGSAVLITRC